MFDGLRKWWAIRSYAVGLRRRLRKQYGHSAFYTPDQVRSAASAGGYNADFLCYAYCMYCTYLDFNAHHQATGENCDYAAMRAEVADRFYSGDTSFDAHDGPSSSSFWDSSSSGSDTRDSGGWFDSSGCDGGFDSGSGDGGDGGGD